MRNSDILISNIEKSFILKFTMDDSSATLQMGETRVTTVITMELEPPFPDRPNEGFLRFNVEFSPMASPTFEVGRPGPEAITLTRLVERSMRQSGAIDQEALCVAAGRKVWGLRVDVHVLDHGGNLADACCLSALAALMVCRKPEVTFGGASGTDIIVHPPEAKEPSHLMIHHLPVSVSFALFQNGDLIAVDPSLKEEEAMDGLLTIVMNQHHELCAVQKAEGIGLSRSQLMRCMRIATDKVLNAQLAQVDELVQKLREALDVHEVARVQARVRRHHQPAGPGPGSTAAVPLGSQFNSQISSQSTMGGAQVVAAGMEGLSVTATEIAAIEADIDEAMQEGEEEEEAEQSGGDMGEDELAAAVVAATMAAAEADELQEARAGPAAGARLGGTLGTAQASSSQQQRGGAVATQKRVKAPTFSSMEEIAAVIAGVGNGAVDDVPDLAAAVKRKKRDSRSPHQ